MADIVISELSVTYLGTDGPALSQIELTIPSGTLCAVVGANGAGKTTLCATLRGFVPQLTKAEVTGTVRVGDLDPQVLPLGEMARDVGYVFQNPFTQMSGIARTVHEELAFGLGNLGVPPAQIRTRVEQIAEQARLTDLLERDPFQLSGGQQQRVALAAVLVMEPDILIIDEPTSQLDPASTDEVFALIAAMKDAGRTIVLIEHKMEHVAAHADQVVLLDAGKVALTGTAPAVFGDPRTSELGLRLPPAVELARALRAEGLDVTGTPADVPELVGSLRAAKVRTPQPPSSGDGASGSAGPTAGRVGSVAPTGSDSGATRTGGSAAAMPGDRGVASSGSAGVATPGGSTPPTPGGGIPFTPGGGAPPTPGGGAEPTSDSGAGSGSPPLVQVGGVSFSYPSGVEAIRGVDLDVVAGETVAIIGQNGAGKSTLAKLLNGLLRPGTGSVQIDGVDTTSRSAARTARVVGYVFQNPDDQLFHSTVDAELRYGLRRLDLDPDEVQARVAAAAQLCGLTDALAENPYDLPYSVRKFVTIALVLALAPQVLVLDEPTAGQDLAGLDRIARIIDHAAGAGHAVITITHDMEFVAANADRVVVMAQGQLIRDDTAARIFADPDAMALARLDTPAIADVAKVLGATDLALDPPALARWVREHR